MMMMQIVLIFMLLTTGASLLLNRLRRRLDSVRVRYGKPDTKNKYPYIVAFASGDFRQCTGTLITPEWVLTAAHCLIQEDYFATHIQYEDINGFSNCSKIKQAVIERVPHPGYREVQFVNDIALVRVTRVKMDHFGKLSAVDYSALRGRTVEYAGLGNTQDANGGDQQPLLIGKGVVTSCLDITEDECTIGPYLCVAPECSNNKVVADSGDSGGPVIYDGKVVGVISYIHDTVPLEGFTVISPYLSWIVRVTGSEIISAKNYESRHS